MAQFSPEYFELSTEMLCTVDFHGHFLEVNPSWVNNMGWSESELLAINFIDIVHLDDKKMVLEEIHKLLHVKGHLSTGLEFRCKHKNALYRWLQWSMFPVKDQPHFFCITRDITSSKRESLLLAQTQKVSQVGSWEIDLSSNELFWSSMTHQIHGTDPDTYCPKLGDGLNFFPDNAQKLVKGYVERLIQHGESFDLELPFITQQGKKTWVRCVGHASMREGMVLRAFGTIEDVSVKKRDKGRYEAIVEISNFGTWEWDLETDEVFYNEQACHMLGLKRDEVEHRASTWDNLVHPYDKINIIKDLNDHINGITPSYRQIFRMKHADGHWVWILAQGKVVEFSNGRASRFSGTHTDISYVKELENKNGKLDDRFQLALTANKFGMWELDLKTWETFWDDNTFELFGINKDDKHNGYERWEMRTHPEDKALVDEAFKNAILNYGSVNVSYRIVLDDRSIRHMTTKAYIERDAEGSALKITGVNWDVTEKIEQEKVFETIIKNIPIMIVFYSAEGNIEWMNTKFTETLGWGHDDFDSMQEMFLQLLPVDEERAEALRFMQDISDEWREFTMLKKDGKETHTTWTSVRLSNGKIVSIGEHTDEKRNRENLIKDQQARMISSAKLSSLGEMASGIAHEINNPLAVIKGKAYHMLKRLEAGEVNVESLIKELTKIEQNSLRIVKIIKGLRTFSRQGEGDPFQWVPFRNVFEDVIELCNERFKHQGVMLKLSGDVESNILCQETQIAQVLLNLINNAYDAVFKMPEAWVKVHVETTDVSTKISVTDSGNGISDEIAQKIMQPFFTTKEIGVGTGLGLSISKGIVEMHGGKFYLDRECENTRFVIELPLMGKNLGNENSTSAGIPTLVV
jgi:PAS domain S-box-containing protein